MLFTGLVGGEGNAIGRVRPSICFHNQLILDLDCFPCLAVTTIARRESKAKVTDQGQGLG